MKRLLSVVALILMSSSLRAETVYRYEINISLIPVVGLNAAVKRGKRLFVHEKGTAKCVTGELFTIAAEQTLIDKGYAIYLGSFINSDGLLVGEPVEVKSFNKYAFDSQEVTK